MALDEVAIPLAFSGGIETKGDRKLVQPVKLLALENGVFSRSTSIIKRNGYTALPRDVDGGGVYEDPKALASRAGELCLFADKELLSFRESTQTWSRVGRAESVVHREDAIAATGTDQSMPDAATLGGLTLVAWEDSRGGVWWSLVEQVGGRVLRPAEQANAAWVKPRVCRNGDRLHLYALDEAQGRIWCMIINPSDYLVTITPVAVAADVSLTFPAYDAQTYDDAAYGTPVAMVWSHTSGGYRVAYIDSSATIATTPAVPSVDAVWADPSNGPIAIAPFVGDYIGVMWCTGNSTAYRFTTYDDLTTDGGGGYFMFLSAAPLRITGAMRFNADVGAKELWCWVECGGVFSTALNTVSVAYVDTAGGLGTSIDLIRRHGLGSRGFLDDNEPTVVLVHPGVFFPYAAVVRGYVVDLAVTPAPTVTAVGRLLVGSSDGPPVRGHLASVQQDESDPRIWRWPGLARELVDVAGGSSQFTETGIRIVRLDFDSIAAYQSVEVARDLVVAGALPMRYDGDTIAELSFHTAPEDLTVAQTLVVPGSLTAGSYLYFFVYEEVDALGVIHPGATSVGTLVEVLTSPRATIATVPTYHLTAKRRVRIGVFRTEVNDTSGDSPAAYRVSSLDPTLSDPAVPNHFLLNDTAVDSVTFYDGMSDAVLVTRERLYTNNVAAPGILSNDPIGLGAVVTTGKGRLFFTAPEDESLVRYSQERRDGYGPELPADLSIPLDPYGGAVTALAVLDDMVVVFKAGAIYGFAGPGPLPNPDAAPQIGFGAAQLITSDVGCISPASLAVTPVGLMFQTARGIYMLSRERQVSYIGAPVEAYNAQTIVSAQSLPGRTMIVFLTNEGSTLLFDYFHGQWSTFTNHQGLDATLVSGVYYYLRANSADLRVFREAPGTYLDATSEIRLYLETAWIKLAQYAQGWQKIWWAHFLGDYLSPHALEVKVATDYRDGWDEPYVLDVDANNDPAEYGAGPYGEGPYGGDGDAVYQRRIHVGLKCQAVRFAISDTTSTAFPTLPLGASFELSELLLTGGAMKPGAKLGANRSG